MTIREYSRLRKRETLISIIDNLRRMESEYETKIDKMNDKLDIIRIDQVDWVSAETPPTVAGWYHVRFSNGDECKEVPFVRDGANNLVWLLPDRLPTQWKNKN